LFLQAFDEGWITDGRGKRVYLSDSIVIMTSNLGAESFRKLTSPLGFLKREVSLDQIRGEVIREMERRFSPEFRNRIDEVVIFSPLGQDEVERIAVRYIDQIRKKLHKAGKELVVTDEGKAAIVKGGYDTAMGARFLKRYIDQHVSLPISQCWDHGSSFVVTAVEQKVVVEVKDQEMGNPDFVGV
jgi:ATP-dependent Clp protease ATP-binding subunit ClpC